MLKSSQSLLYPDQTDEIVAANPAVGANYLAILASLSLILPEITIFMDFLKSLGTH